MTQNFFSEYRILNSGTEIPPLYTAWCSISAISAVLGRRVWLDMGPFTIYPNMFIVLIAGSGKERKSTAINVTAGMLRALTIKPRMLSKKLTVAGIVEELKVESIIGDAYVGLGSQGFLISDELINFLNPGSIKEGLGDFLLDLYDCREEFVYSTRSQGKETLRDLQLGMLVGTTPQSLSRAIPEESIGSGLASRMLFVYEDVPAPPVAIPQYTPQQISGRDFCVESLSRIQRLNGSVTFPQDSREWYEKCYMDRCHNSGFYSHPLLSGYASRRAIHILKIAISLTVGLTEGLVITPKILTMSEALLSQNESRLEEVMRLMTMNEQGQIAEAVSLIIQRARKIEREDLLHRVSHKINSRELTDVIETLLRSGRVKSVVVNMKIYYVPGEKK